MKKFLISCISILLVLAVIFGLIDIYGNLEGLVSSEPHAESCSFFVVGIIFLVSMMMLIWLFTVEMYRMTKQGQDEINQLIEERKEKNPKETLDKVI